MPVINVTIRDKVAVSDGKLVCGNKDYTAVFDFDAEWDAYDTKTARFIWNGHPEDVIFTGTECPIPAVSDTHVLEVGVFAGDLQTTTPAKVWCDRSILCGEGVPADPAPDVYAQLMEKLNATSAKVTETDDGVDIEVTDVHGSTKATVKHGADGPQGNAGADGQPGKDGIDGKDGFSPVVAVEDITGGHRVTITDKEGAKSFDVMDGKDGEGGSGGAPSDLNAAEGEPGHVLNRTHYMERMFDPIEWDGNTEGRDFVDISAVYGQPPGSIVFWKISDQVLTSDLITKATIANTTSDGVTASGSFEVNTELEAHGIYIGSASIWHTDDNGLRYDHSDATIFSTSIMGDFTTTLGAVIPSTGTYCMQSLGPYLTVLSGDVYHTMDDRYLPDTIARISDVEALIMGAIEGAY